LEDLQNKNLEDVQITSSVKWCPNALIRNLNDAMYYTSLC